MNNKEFIKKILHIVFNNPLTKKKQLEASELYLNNDASLLYKKDNGFSYYIDGTKVEVVWDGNVIKYYCDDESIELNEYILACILLYKKEYYIDNDISFSFEDIQLTNYYFSNLFITNIYYDEYLYRFNFYYGLIDSLYVLEMNESCIKMMVDFFEFLDSRITYDKKYMDNEKMNLFRIVKDKYQYISNNSNILLDIFKSKQYSISSLGKFIYMCSINCPHILSNNNLIYVYEYLLNNYNSVQKTTQFYFNLNIQYKIIKWFNNEINDDFMKLNIKTYEVMFCYVTYLYNNKRYEDICDLFNDYKFNIINNEIMKKIISSYYICNNYDKAVNLFTSLKLLTYEQYVIYKYEFPNLFNDKYMDTIIDFITESCNYDDAIKILELEDKMEYELLLLSKNNFNLINDKFNDYLGVYDAQLIKIFQKEIINDFNSLRGYYNHIPEIIIEKFEKMKRIKNGKYYICELITYMIDNSYVAYSDELQQYCKGLEV